MLYVRNYDKPGFVGAIGNVFGDLGLNIATFHLGRKEESGEAIALVEIDGTISDDAVRSVAALEQIVRVDRLSFTS
jgi:D-3-phosphoglycerate dehydrogenase